MPPQYGLPEETEQHDQHEQGKSYDKENANYFKKSAQAIEPFVGLYAVHGVHSLGCRYGKAIQEIVDPHTYSNYQQGAKDSAGPVSAGNLDA